MRIATTTVYTPIAVAIRTVPAPIGANANAAMTPIAATPMPMRWTTENRAGPGEVPAPRVRCDGLLRRGDDGAIGVHVEDIVARRGRAAGVRRRGDDRAVAVHSQQRRRGNDHRDSLLHRLRQRNWRRHARF